MIFSLPVVHDESQRNPDEKLTDSKMSLTINCVLRDDATGNKENKFYIVNSRLNKLLVADKEDADLCCKNDGTKKPENFVSEFP